VPSPDMPRKKDGTVAKHTPERYDADFGPLFIKVCSYASWGTTVAVAWPDFLVHNEVPFIITFGGSKATREATAWSLRPITAA
jgi:hypothetical protein